jgi:NitT/TauT family transport system substrate-binding protein
MRSTLLAAAGGAVALALAAFAAPPAAAPSSPSAPSAPVTPPPPSPGDPVKVRLQLNWVPEPEFGGFFAAAQDGLYRDAGLDVEIIRGASGTPAPQLTASGQVEFGVVSGDQILTFNERGAKLVGVFAVFHTSPMGVMVKADAPWRTLEELWRSDATVAMEAGLPFVKYLNARFGAGRVRIVPTGTGLGAFERGAVQAQQCFISAEPVQMEVKGQRVRVFSLAEGGYDPYTVTVATRRDYLDANRATCERFVRATREGWLRYLKDPARYNPSLHALNPAMSLEAMAAAARLQDPLIAPAPGSAVPVGGMTAERWQRLAEQMKELGLIKAVPADIASVFWNSPAGGTATPARP